MLYRYAKDKGIILYFGGEIAVYICKNIMNRVLVILQLGLRLSQDAQSSCQVNPGLVCFGVTNKSLSAKLKATTRQEANKKRQNRPYKDREILLVDVRLKGMKIIIQRKTIRRQGATQASSTWEEA